MNTLSWWVNVSLKNLDRPWAPSLQTAVMIIGFPVCNRKGDVCIWVCISVFVCIWGRASGGGRAGCWSVKGQFGTVTETQSGRETHQALDVFENVTAWSTVKLESCALDFPPHVIFCLWQTLPLQELQSSATWSTRLKGRATWQMCSENDLCMIPEHGIGAVWVN